MLYAIKAFGCLSQHFITRKGCIVVSLATREMAAVLASIRVQENLPKNAKLSTICYKQIPWCNQHQHQPSQYGSIVKTHCSHRFLRTRYPTVRYCSLAMLPLPSRHWCACRACPFFRLCSVLPGSHGRCTFVRKEACDDEVPRSDHEACPLRGR